MYRFSTSKILPFVADDDFIHRVTEEFSVTLPVVRWRGGCPQKPESVLVRQITPDSFVASLLWIYYCAHETADQDID